MADHKNRCTGIILVRAVTPVIQALFAGFAPEPLVINNGAVTIARATDRCDPSWGTLIENVIDLLNERAIPVPDEDSVAAVIGALYAGITNTPVSTNPDFEELLASIDGDCDPQFGDLYEIARAIDDGHGLSEIQVMGAYTCSALRLWEFGGYYERYSKEVAVATGTQATMRAADDLQLALSGNDFEAAAQAVLSHTRTLLDAIVDPAQHAAVTQRLSAKVSAMCASQSAKG